MLTYEEIKTCDNIHKIPKEIHINKNVCFDCNLLRAIDNQTDRDYRYDFDLFFQKY